jgi:hypothetical protein
MTNYEEDEGEENVYQEETREGLVDDDEISPEEEGFMQGYEEAEEADKEEKEEKKDEE